MFAPTVLTEREKIMKYEEETNKILNAFFEVHKELGCGFLEQVYQKALEREFQLQNIPYEREKKISVMYKGVALGQDYYADFVCYNHIIVEVKALSKLVSAHKAQLLNYLTATNLEIGLLVNFGETSCKYERISRFKTTAESVGRSQSV